MPRFSTYVGLDVHKKSIVLAYASSGGEQEPQTYGSIPNGYTRLKAKLLKLGLPGKADGFACDAVAPAKTQAAAGPHGGGHTRIQVGQLPSYARS